MSRTHKAGLDYFSFDVDFFNDPKIEFVSAKFDELGELIIIKLLCRIYRNGYYIEWDEDQSLLFTKRVGNNINQSLVDNVVDELLKRDFFCNKKYKTNKILTSNGIQKRFFEATKRRKEINVYKEYLIANIAGLNVNIINLNVDINTQRKVKERKVKERKEYGEFKNVKLSDSEYEKLQDKYGNSAISVIEKFSAYLPNKKGQPYKDHYAAILRNEEWLCKGITTGRATQVVL